MRSIQKSNNLDAIRKYFAKNYSPEDRKKARGLCSRCRNKFLQIQRDDADPKKTADPSILDDPIDWDSMYFPTITRSSGVTDLDDLKNCNCDICLVAREHAGVVGNSSGTGQKKGRKSPFPKGFPAHKSVLEGRPPYKEPVQIPQKPVTLCDVCFQIVGRGINHPQPCSKSSTTRSENLMAFVEKFDGQKSAEKLATSTIKKKEASAEKGATSIKLLSNNNKEIKVPLTRAKVKRALFPDGNVCQLKKCKK